MQLSRSTLRPMGGHRHEQEAQDKELCAGLLAAVPELADAYKTELEWWGEDHPGAHNVYAFVLLPYLLDLLSTNGDKEILKRIFSHVEDLAASSDEYVRGVVKATILWRLAEPSVIRDAHPHFGPATLQCLKEEEDFYAKWAASVQEGRRRKLLVEHLKRMDKPD